MALLLIAFFSGSALDSGLGCSGFDGSGFCCQDLTAQDSAAQEAVTIESLLKEMVDRDRIASYPKSDFRLKQASSYDRKSKTPDDPDGWFANHDRSTNDEQHNYVRIEENNGRKEWVVMDHEGAGAITRFWVPWRNQLRAKKRYHHSLLS